MADFLSPSSRSERMSRIRGSNTKPEMRLRRMLHAAGFRYKLHASRLPGRPDIVLPKYETVVFVHGCFWHRHPGCKVASEPKSNKAFWASKFSRNVARDRQNSRKLRAQGWHVYVVWECQLNSALKSTNALRRLTSRFKSTFDPARTRPSSKAGKTKAR